MKNILLDTNIYGLALEKKDIMSILIFLANEKQKTEKELIITVKDRVGLLKDISAVFSANKIIKKIFIHIRQKK